MTFTFNSVVSGSGGGKAIKIFLDKNGNIIDNSKNKYGVYNKVIKIKIEKLLFVEKHKLGIGDIIDFFTKTFYIKNLIVYLTKGNCGCEARRIKFNKYYIPWYTFKIRNLYFSDEGNVNTIKNIKKMNIKLNKYKEPKEMNGPMSPPKIATPIHQEVKDQKPIEPIKVKKSCGCSRRNG